MNRSPLLNRVFLVMFFTAVFFSCKKDDDCKPATTALAGDDQTVVGTTTTLSANAPVSGVGTWTLVTGNDGIMADPLNPQSSFTGTIGTTYTLKWSVTGCPSSEDEVQVTFICNPANVAGAGPDQTVGGTSTTLAATGSPGTWTILSGNGGSIGNATIPTSTFTGTAGTYTLRWTVACPATHDDVQITFITDPQFAAVDKTSVVNGEIITVTGFNFVSNFNGGSQINAKKTNDPLIGQEVFYTILSRTSTEIKAVVSGVNGGASGSYNLRYVKKPDASAATYVASSLNITLVDTNPGQFYTSQGYSVVSVAKGAEASFGVKNGSLTPGDYTLKLVGYDYTTGVSTETTVTVSSVTAGGFGGSMDKVAFTVPASLASGIYYVKVTYSGKTLMGGWGSLLNVI
jgi:hypothetical protein